MTAQAEYENQELTLGQLLKRARIARGLTINQLSRDAGIAVGQVHKLENDRVKKVNPAHLAALSGPLDQPVHQLFRVAGYPAGEIPLLEPELARRLAELPPQALEQITTMLNNWLLEHSASWPASVPDAIEIEQRSDDIN